MSVSRSSALLLFLFFSLCIFQSSSLLVSAEENIVLLANDQVDRTVATNDAQDSKTLFDFTKPGAEELAAEWTVINDNVMGGVSTSSVSLSKYSDVSALSFAGTVRTENYGGFATGRTHFQKEDATEYDGVFIDTVSPSKSEFCFIMLDEFSFEYGIQYESCFKAGVDGMTRSFVPFKSLKANWRGMKVPFKGPINQAKIVELGFYETKDQTVGDFELLVSTIGFYKNKAVETVVIKTVSTDDFQTESTPVFDFTGSDAEDLTTQWSVINDNVMGGVSTSSVSLSKYSDVSALSFAGTVKTDNYGGFATARTNFPTHDASEDPTKFDGVFVDTVSPSNSDFCLTVTDEWSFEYGVFYQACFKTGVDSMARSFVPFKSLKPIWRGVKVPFKGPINQAKLVEVGFIVTKAQTVGDFELLVSTIGFYKNKAVETVVVKTVSTETESEPVFDFTGSDAEDLTTQWSVVNDNVMGGVSTSSVSLAKYSDVSALSFAGTVSTDNYGGFATARAHLQTQDATKYDGVFVDTVSPSKSDFCLTVKDEFSFEYGIQYQACFTAGVDSMTRSFVPFKSLKPVWRGTKVPFKGPINQAKIVEVGFLETKAQTVGDFELLVSAIGFYKNN